MRLIKTTYLFFFLIQLLNAQADLRGMVSDKQSALPLVGATVFVEHSTKGAVTDSVGSFILNDLPSGTVPLVISYLGYETKFINIKPGSQHDLKIELVPGPIQLATVEVKALKDKKRQRHIKKMSQAFLGSTKNASFCYLKNKEKIRLQVEKNGDFKATAEDLLEVENRALGYTVYFLLNHFSMQGEEVSFSGKPYFKHISPLNESEKNRWEINRKSTYYGSIRHFLQSLYHDQLESEGFDIFFAKLNPDQSFSTIRRVSSNEITNQTSSRDHKYLTIPTFLQVVYTRENDEISPPGTKTNVHGLTKLGRPAEKDLIQQEKSNFKQKKISGQVSWLFARMDRIAFDKNGLFLKPDLVKEYGYWGYEGVADLLPIEYQPE